jgi:hypothetical protein
LPVGRSDQFEGDIGETVANPYVVKRMSNEPISAWFPFEEREKHRFKDEPALSCFLGKLFCSAEERNTYDGVRRWTYHDVFSEFVAAQRSIWSLRRKGSHWTIKELPVVVISGEKRSLVIGERAKAPLFRSWRRRLRSLEEYGTYLLKPSRASLSFCVICEPSLVPPAKLPFYEHDSLSQGGNFRFSDKSVAELEIEHLLSVIGRINMSLQGEGLRAESWWK